MIRIQLNSPRNDLRVYDALVEAGIEGILRDAGGGTVSCDIRLSVNRGSQSAQDDREPPEDGRTPP